MCLKVSCIYSDTHFAGKCSHCKAPVARINPKPRHLRGLERCRCHGGTTKAGEGAGSCAGACDWHRVSALSDSWGLSREIKRQKGPVFDPNFFLVAGLRPAWLPLKLIGELVTMTALTKPIQFPILPLTGPDESAGAEGSGCAIWDATSRGVPMGA